MDDDCIDDLSCVRLAQGIADRLDLRLPSSEEIDERFSSLEKGQGSWFRRRIAPAARRFRDAFYDDRSSDGVGIERIERIIREGVAQTSQEHSFMEEFYRVHGLDSDGLRCGFHVARYVGGFLGVYADGRSLRMSRLRLEDSLGKGIDIAVDRLLKEGLTLYHHGGFTGLISGDFRSRALDYLKGELDWRIDCGRDMLLMDSVLLESGSGKGVVMSGRGRGPFGGIPLSGRIRLAKNDYRRGQEDPDFVVVNSDLEPDGRRDGCLCRNCGHKYDDPPYSGCPAANEFYELLLRHNCALTMTMCGARGEDGRLLYIPLDDD